MKIILWFHWLLVLAAGVDSFAQVSTPSQVCTGQSFVVESGTDPASTVFWDFCQGDLKLTPTFNERDLTDSDIPVGTSFIQANGKWYGFVCSLNNNSLFRLDFGPSLNNPAPAVVNLGNIGGLLSSPQDIEVVEFESMFYAFVYNRLVNRLVRINLGSDIESTVGAASALLTGEGFTNGGLDVQFDEANWIVAITNSTDLTLVNLGDSPANAPSDGSVLETSTIPDVASIADIKFLHEDDEWYAFTVAYTSQTLQLLHFGSGLFVQPTAETVVTFNSSPYGLVAEIDNGRVIVFVATLQGNLIRLDYGASVTNLNPTIVNLGNLGGLNNLIKIDIANSNSQWFALSTNWASNEYYVIDFPQPPCEFDTATSSLPIDTITAQTSGSFYISLHERAVNGLAHSYENSIEILSKPAPALLISTTSICEGSEAELTAVSDQQLVDVSWDLGVNGLSTEINPRVTFNSAGVYPISVKVVSENGCDNLFKWKIGVYPSLEGAAAFSLPSTLLCTNNAFTFSTTTPDIYDGNLSYQWSVDDTPAGTDRDLQYTFTTTGTKDIKLVTSIPGCASEITKTTSSVEAGPVVDFTFTGICEDDLFSFDNLTTDPVTAYLWNFGNGNTSASTDAQQTFADYGDYAVSLTATNAVGCENITTKTVKVHARPVAGFLADGPPNSCSGTPTQLLDQSSSPDGDAVTQWLWDFGDASSDNTKDPIHTFSAAGLYNVSLTVTSEAGCSANAIQPVDIYQSPSVDFSFSPACDDLPALFTPPADNSIVDWYWEIGTSYYTTSSPLHIFKSPGNYPLYLEVTASNGCESSRHDVINVPIPLNPDFSYLKNCIGQAAVLTDVTTGSDPVLSREWTFDSGEAFSGSPINFVFDKEQTKIVTMKVTAASGCSYSVSKQIAILPPPVAGFTADPPSGAYPLEITFTNTSSGATHYLWNFNDGSGAVSTDFSPVHTFDDVGSYDVKLIAFNSQECESSFFSDIAIVAPLPDADIENIALTPNADGSLKLIVTIHNKGNTIIRNLPLDLDFSGVLKLRQVLEDRIDPGAKFNFVFSTGIVDAGDLRYVCASADVADDLSPAGNRMCKELNEGLNVFQAFPNPASGVLNIEWVQSGEKTVRLSLVDTMGRIVFDANLTGSDGLNRRALNLDAVKGGIYYLVIRQEGAVTTQKIAVSTRL